ncbi:MAG TPA: short-chain dehydrogenase, partial [Opitutae bacterium]|nr:short-chain dehydrogenase [Opitutae bacterium]
MRLKDKVIFLSGGSTGIGLDCAKAYAAEGAKVVIVARHAAASADAAKSLGEG